MHIDLAVLVPAAFIAGVLMFLAPCTLPIVPAYLAFIAGKGKGAAITKRRIIYNAAAYVLGFSIVFITLGLFASSLGSLIGPWRSELSVIAGVIIIIFGLQSLGLLNLGFLSRDYNLGVPRFLEVGRPQSSFLLGFLFALAWSPCIGPILGSVLLVASSTGTLLEGVLLLSVFSAGLALPFMLCAFFLGSIDHYLESSGVFAKRASQVGGALLILIGIFMVSGTVGYFSEWAFRVLEVVEYDALLQYL